MGRIRLRRQRRSEALLDREVAETGLVQLYTSSNRGLTAAGLPDQEVLDEEAADPWASLESLGAYPHLSMSERTRLLELIEAEKSERQAWPWDDESDWDVDLVELLKPGEGWSRMIWKSGGSFGTFLHYQRCLDGFWAEEMARLAGVEAERWLAWEARRDIPPVDEVVRVATRIYPRLSQREQLLEIRRAMAA